MLLTWNKDQLNNNVAAYSTTAVLTQNWVFLLKTMLLGITGSTIEGSSDSATAGMDSVDRWAAASNVVRNNAGVHSWIVINTPLVRICLDQNGAAESTSTSFIFAKTAFTGGTTSARPTSVDEWTYPASSNILIHDNTASQNRLHMVWATRGDFWLWSHKVGIASPAAGPATFSMNVTLPTPVAGVTDTWPATYVQGNSSGFALRAEYIFAPGNSSGYGWRGRLAMGNLISALSGCTMTHYGASTPLIYIPVAGGVVTKAYPKLPFQIWSYDATANSYTDFKGDVVDVKVGPYGVMPGAPDNQDSPTMRLVGNLWLPLGADSPSYG